MHVSERSIPTLDGWRAIAISFVLFSHGYPSLQRDLGLPEISFREPLGILGVEVFFALSGFLITTKLLQEKERFGRISLSNFYARRAFRILPAALLFLLSVALLSSIGLLPYISPGRIASTVIFFANYSTAEWSYYVAHFWSLAVEEHFYFVWPALFVLVTKRQRLKIAIISAILIVLWRAFTWKFQITTTDPAKYFGRTDIEADSIMWGAALALGARNVRIERALSIVSHPSVWIALAIISVFSGLYESANWKTDFTLFSLCRITVPLVVYGAVIDPKGTIGRLLERAPISFVGRISYSLYLWQQLFMVVPAEAPLGILQKFPLNFLAAFSCAIASYHLVEQPMIRLWRTKRLKSVAIQA